jgi:alpha-methylacyl-CoA racemase
MMPTMVDTSDHSPHIGPLSHLRVLDMSRLHPGAFVTGLLADFGADVVRVEQPGSFDPLRYDDAMNVTYNRGKRSFTLDLKHERAPEVLRRLVRGVDVVVESARPGSLEARGIGYEQLAAERPELVWCSITGFGHGSPYADRPAHDVSFLGYSGMLALMAGDTVPSAPDFILAVPAGALMATVGILVALQQRDRTGHGSMVDASVVDAASWMLGEHVSRVAAGGTVGWGKHAGRRAYRCADGRLITLGAAEPRTWGTLCELLDRQDLTPRLMDSDQQALTDELAALFATRPASEWVAELGPTAACLGPVNRPEDLLTDPHVLARRDIVPLDDDSGRVVFPNPLRFVPGPGAESRGYAATAPPSEPGAATDDVLAAAGYDADEVAALREAGAI